MFGSVLEVMGRANQRVLLCETIGQVRLYEAVPVRTAASAWDETAALWLDGVLTCEELE